MSNLTLVLHSQPSDKRSKTVILAKNLPAGTKAEELRELFSKSGSLGRVVLPPAGVTAIVEFVEPSEARAAFYRLAYTKVSLVSLNCNALHQNSYKR